MTTKETIAKLITCYKDVGFTKEEAATEMSKNNVPYDIAVKVLHGL
jgi:hypothetical protein